MGPKIRKLCRIYQKREKNVSIKAYIDYMTTRSDSESKSKADDKQATKTPMSSNMGCEREREEEKWRTKTWSLLEAS